MVRTQKFGIKYKKPTGVQRFANDDIQQRSEDLMLSKGRVVPKVWRLRDRTGRLGTHFFTQNSGIVFLEQQPRKTDRGDRSEKVSQINSGASEKTSCNWGAGRVARRDQQNGNG